MNQVSHWLSMQSPDNSFLCDREKGVDYIERQRTKLVSWTCIRYMTSVYPTCKRRRSFWIQRRAWFIWMVLCFESRQWPKGYLCQTWGTSRWYRSWSWRTASGWKGTARQSPVGLICSGFCHRTQVWWELDDSFFQFWSPAGGKEVVQEVRAIEVKPTPKVTISKTALFGEEFNPKDDAFIGSSSNKMSASGMGKKNRWALEAFLITFSSVCLMMMIQISTTL